MAQRARRRPMHEINIVPYVDVMLVLLVIFMVTAPLVTPAIIDLPTVDKASAPRIVPIEVFVKADEQLVVRQRDNAGAIVVERTLSRGELASFIKSVRGKGEPAVLIGGDKNARYEAVLAVISVFGVTACTVREAKGFGRQKGYLDQYRGGEFSAAYLPKVEITAWVEVDRYEEFVEKVAKAARTGRIGDGKILAVPTAEQGVIEF